MPKSSWRRGKRLGPEDDPGLRRRFQLFMFPAEISNMGGERIPSKGVKLRWMNSFVGHGGSLDKSTGSITWENPVVISSQVELTKHRYSEEFFPRKEKLTVIWGSRKMAGSLSGSMSLRRWPVCTLDLAGLCRLDENFEIELTCPLKNTASGMVHIRVVTYRLEDMPNPPDYPSPSLQDNASIQMLGEALSVFVPVKDAAAPGLRGTNKSNLYDVLGRMAKKTHVKEMTMSFYEVVHPAKAPKPEPPGQLAAPAGGMERPEIDGLSNEVRTYPTLAPAADSSKPVKKRSGLIQGFQHGLSLSSARLMAKHHQQNEQQWNPSSLGDLSVQEDAWSVAGGTDQSSDSDSECRDTPMLSLVVSRAACEVSRSDTLAIETSVGPSSSKASSDENWHALDRILESRDDSDQAGAVEEHSSVAVQVSQSLAMADRVAADVVSTEETERQGRHMAKKTSSSSRVTRHDTWTTGLNGFAAARPPTLQGNGCVQGPGKVLAAPPARVPNAEPASVAVRPGSGSGSGSARPAVATSTSVRAEAGREQQADRSRHDNLTKGNHAAAPAKRVVCVAVDGSDRSPKMLSWVISGVAKEDDELHVVSVAEPDWSPCVFPNSRQAAELKLAAEAVAHGVLKRTEMQKQVESMEVEGLVCAPSMFGDCLSSPRRVGEAIVKYLVKCKADLLILDDGGMNDVQRSLLTVFGIVMLSTYCVERAPCPVLVFKS